MPRAAVADEAGRVRVVHHHQRAVAVGEVADLPEPRDDAVHREHAVGRDQLHARARRFLEARLELVHVVVGIAQALRLAQADAVDDARVVERVADHRVLLVEQGLEQAAVGVEARRIQDRVVHAEERAEARLEFLVHALRAADEAHRGHAVPVTVERAVRGLADRRMVGEREVIVGAEVDQFAAVGEPDHGLLRRAEHALRLEEAGALQVFGLGGQSVEKATIHGVGRLRLRSADYKGLIIAPWHPARTIRRAGTATTMNRTAPAARAARCASTNGSGAPGFSRPAASRRRPSTAGTCR